MSKTEPVLKPCPFCGERAAFRWSGGVLLAECTGCGASKGDGGAEPVPMGDGMEFHRAAAARWNARAPSDDDRYYLSVPANAKPNDRLPIERYSLTPAGQIVWDRKGQWCRYEPEFEAVRHNEQPHHPQ